MDRHFVTVTVSAGLAMGAAASGQTFAEYFLDGLNLTDAGRGICNADSGDIFRMSLRVNHDGLSYAGGKVEILFSGVDPEDIILTEDAFAFPFDPWEVGRTPITRIVVSDGPADATQPHNEDVVASDGTITDVNDDFFDLASTPPGLGGLAGAFPTASGDEIFVFDYVYDGGIDFWDASSNRRARLWRDGDDINGVEVNASHGDTLFCPSPGTCGLLGLAGVAFGRRRRRARR